jgi:hypothetical protein
MARLLCVVKDTFEIQGRGLVFMPGIVPQAGEIFRVGDLLSFKSPDGTVIARAIDALNMMFRAPHRMDEEHDIHVMLKGLTQADLPIGTEICSVDSPPKGVHQ